MTTVTMMRMMMTAAQLQLLLLLLTCQAANARMMESQQQQSPPSLLLLLEEITRQECLESGGIVVADVGDGSSRLPEYRCASNGEAITGLIYTLPDEWPSDEGEVCCGGPEDEEPPPAIAAAAPPYELRPTMTRQECEIESGTIVGDIGDGAIFWAQYLCESNGQPPLGNIVDEPMAIDGEVCCGPSEVLSSLPLPEITRQECLALDMDAVVVADDDGSGLCQNSHGGDEEKPIGIIVPPGFVVAELCCPATSEAVAPPPPASSLLPFFTSEQCQNMNGEVVGDIGNGAIFEPDYVCDSNGKKPFGIIVSLLNDGSPVAVEGSICCGPSLGGGAQDDTPPTLSRDDCTQLGGLIIYDRGDGSSRRPDYRCDSNGLAIIGIVMALPDQAMSFEGEVCCGPPIALQEFTRQECLQNNGVVVGDIGDGATRRYDFICESSGEPIIAIIIPAEGEPIAIEGEVCCGAEADTAMIVNRQECTNDLNGIIVQDMGDGSSRRPGYLCESSGEPIIAIIVPAEGEPIAREGEVCCGAETDIKLLFPEMTRDECELEYDGVIIGDIGDGVTLRDDYLCITNGEPILGVIVSSSSQFEYIAIDGEVCCGLVDYEDDEVTEHCNWFCQLQACSKSLKGWIGDHLGRD